ncbi:TetR family transcriptional regulator, partial [Streptomyces sp. SID4931]|nr:TetR family transcriptional regulator [Streptomyces sp. SID4931]
MPATSRRRPATRKGRPVLTRESIAAKALEMAGAQGFASLTMRALATELGVTVRALYNYVEDRQDVVHLAVDTLLTSWN